MSDVRKLLGRSHRLGADRRITNFAGGNTSAKVDLPDPVTGATTRVLVVKGSGGDLGTLAAEGLAILDLDRIRALRTRPRIGVHEDDLVALYDSCRFGIGGAAPSIDTPLHALLDADHVDHTHPDAVIALAAAVDGDRLVTDCYGDDVLWLDWRRPGFELGSDAPRRRRSTTGRERCRPRWSRTHLLGCDERRVRGNHSRPRRPRRAVPRRARRPRTARRDGRSHLPPCPSSSGDRRRPASGPSRAPSPERPARWSGTSPTPPSSWTS